jgi:hypothetical protein
MERMPHAAYRDPHQLVLEAEAEHHAVAQECELRCLDELARRRREIAAECSRLLHRAPTTPLADS